MYTFRHNWYVTILGGCLFLFIYTVPNLAAQIILDGTVGPSGALAGPDFQITQDLGATVGSNLFHSFTEFNLSQMESATFSGSAAISNVLSRVTGGNPSSIDGTLRSTIPGANLFFLNPAGVVFGPNAQVDVDGSFTVSTADTIGFGDGGRFDAANPTNDVLTTAPVEAFGFLGETPSSVSVVGSQLQVATGESIRVVSGDIYIAGGRLVASSGEIDLISVKSAGEVENTPEPELSGFDELGTISMTDGSVIDVSGGSDQILITTSDGVTFGEVRLITMDSNTVAGPGGGQVRLVGDSLRMNQSAVQQTTEEIGAGGGVQVSMRGDVELNDHARILSIAYGSGKGGDIVIRANRIELDFESFIVATAAGAGSGGEIQVNTGRLDVIDGSMLGTVVFGSGPAGAITIQADDIAIQKSIRSDLDTGIISLPLDRPNFAGGGKGSLISIDTGTLDVFVDADVSAGFTGVLTSTNGRGASGDLDIVANHIRLDGQFTSWNYGFIPTGRTFITSGSFANFRDPNTAVGSSGNMTLNVGRLELSNGVFMGTYAWSLTETGRGGDVTINAGEIIAKNLVDVWSASLGTQDAGNITINTGKLVGVNTFRLVAATAGSGNAGDIVVSADHIILDGRAAPGDPQFPFNNLIIAGSEQFLGPVLGEGGDITITARKVELLRNSRINSLTSGHGNGGNVTVTADEITIDHGDFYIETPFGLWTSIDTLAYDFFESGNEFGNAGNVVVNAGKLSILNDRSFISASTQTSGTGGSVIVNVAELNLENGGAISSASTSTRENAGAAGDVIVTASGAIHLRSGSAISTAAKVGTGGSVNVRAGTTIDLADDSAITSAAGVNGGDLSVQASERIQLIDSRITAEAGNNGGNIVIDPRFVILDNSQIVANAILGAGGNIEIVAGVFLVSADSIIDASSQFGVSGNIEVFAPDVDIAGSLAVLPGSFTDIGMQLSECCAERLEEDVSSFIVVGRGGIPIEPTNFVSGMGAGDEKE